MAKRKPATETPPAETGLAVAHPEPEPALDIAVEWGGVSIGDQVARLSFRADRNVLPLDAADRVLAGRRLDVVVACHAPGDAPGQTYLPDTPHGGAAIKATVDSKSFSTNAKRISGSLAFNIESVDVALLGSFARRTGSLLVSEIEDLSGEPAAPDDDADEGHDAE